jgi:hypothetical protein
MSPPKYWRDYVSARAALERKLASLSDFLLSNGGTDLTLAPAPTLPWVGVRSDHHFRHTVKIEPIIAAAAATEAAAAAQRVARI